MEVATLVREQVGKLIEKTLGSEYVFDSAIVGAALELGLNTTEIGTLALEFVLVDSVCTNVGNLERSLLLCLLEVLSVKNVVALLLHIELLIARLIVCRWQFKLALCHCSCAQAHVGVGWNGRTLLRVKGVGLYIVGWNTIHGCTSDVLSVIRQNKQHEVTFAASLIVCRSGVRSISLYSVNHNGIAFLERNERTTEVVFVQDNSAIVLCCNLLLGVTVKGLAADTWMLDAPVLNVLLACNLADYGKDRVSVRLKLNELLIPFVLFKTTVTHLCRRCLCSVKVLSCRMVTWGKSTAWVIVRILSCTCVRIYWV